MKKLLVLMLCITILCAFPTIVFAEEGEDIETVVTTAEVTAEPVTEFVPDPDAKTTAEKFVSWIQENLEEISVIVTLILTVFYQVRKHGLLNKSIGTLNNNAISVAENSNTSIQQALVGISGVSDIVSGFTEQIATLLAEVRKTAEERDALESKFTEATQYIKTAKLANVELANEVAELLVLANIPNGKKEELYSRHRAAVEAIASAEQTEVIVDDGQKA